MSLNNNDYYAKMILEYQVEEKLIDIDQKIFDIIFVEIYLFVLLFNHKRNKINFE